MDVCNTPKSQSPSDFALSTDLHYGRSMRRSLSPPSWEDYGFGPASACRAGRYGSDNGNETIDIPTRYLFLYSDSKTSIHRNALSDLFYCLAS